MVAHSKRNKYRELFDETFKLWEKYSEEYCSMLEKYYDALEKKRRAQITPLRKIREAELHAFPVITIFCIQDEYEAIEYLLNLSEDKLRFVRKQMKDFIDSKLYKDLKAKTFDFEHAVKMKKYGKKFYAISAESCGAGRRHGKHLGPDLDK